jgi:hypothetical protein
MEFSWDRVKIMLLIFIELIYFKLTVKERSQFLEKADVAYKLQEQAEETAAKAIKQLEEFITEDAKIVNLINFFHRIYHL